MCFDENSENADASVTVKECFCLGAEDFKSIVPPFDYPVEVIRCRPYKCGCSDGKTVRVPPAESHSNPKKFFRDVVRRCVRRSCSDEAIEMYLHLYG